MHRRHIGSFVLEHFFQRGGDQCYGEGPLPFGLVLHFHWPRERIGFDREEGEERVKWWGENDSFVFIYGYFCGGQCLS